MMLGAGHLWQWKNGWPFLGVPARLCQSLAVALNKELSSNVVLLVLRAVVGVNMAWLHGWDKLSHFSAKAGSFPDPLSIGHKYALVLAIAGEFFGAILMATGLLGRAGAFLVSLTSALTLFWILHGTPWREREVWELYFAGSTTILLLGCGRYSLDTLVWKKLGKGGGKTAPSPSKR
jgi:putative oxidoreductase